MTCSAVPNVRKIESGLNPSYPGQCMNLDWACFDLNFAEVKIPNTLDWGFCRYGTSLL